MIAYNRAWFNNLTNHSEADYAFDNGYITESEREFIKKEYPVGFYSPNIFISAGLFLITVIICLFTLGLFLLMFLSGSSGMISGLLFFFSGVTYATGEFLIRHRHHYKSGADSALLWISASCCITAFGLLNSVSATMIAALIFLITLYFVLRFAYLLAAIICHVAFLSFIYLVFDSVQIPFAVLPFIVMLVSMAVYLFTNRIAFEASYYKDCLTATGVTALLTFYSAGNYFVILSFAQMHFRSRITGLPYSLFFWMSTALIPLIFIGYGILKKKIVFLRTGLLLLAITVLTFKHYHFLMSAELLMILVGLILSVTAYFITRFLKTPRYGYTAKETAATQAMNIEAIIIAETMGGAEQKENTFKGGSFGGGGATGNY